jgi:hypothetical protein
MFPAIDLPHRCAVDVLVICHGGFMDLLKKILLTEDEAAAVVNFQPRTLQLWRVKGGGPPFTKIGRCVRYHVDDLEQWAAERRRTSTADDGGRQ